MSRAKKLVDDLREVFLDAARRYGFKVALSASEAAEVADAFDAMQKKCKGIELMEQRLRSMSEQLRKGATEIECDETTTTLTPISADQFDEEG